MRQADSTRYGRRKILLWIEFAIFAALQVYFLYEMIRAAIASL